MAVISNLNASLTSFTINGKESTLHKCVGLYGTVDVLNGGESLDNTLIYIFNISGLKDYTVESIIVRTLLLNSDGSLASSKKFYGSILNYGLIFSGIINSNEASKTIFPISFKESKILDLDNLSIVFTALNLSNESCYFCILSLLIEVKEINSYIQLTFSGPSSGRTHTSIVVAPLVVKIGSTEVSFTKDPINQFNSTNDSVEGRLYLKKDGIFVDGYLYGVNTPATETKHGTVKLSESSFVPIYEEDREGNLIQVGIEAPTDTGVAASPLLVYNALASAISYTDEVIAPILLHVNEVQATLDGIEAPLVMNIENNNGNIESLGDTLTFSNDFELKDNKLYIKWLEIS